MSTYDSPIEELFAGTIQEYLRETSIRFFYDETFHQGMGYLRSHPMLVPTSGVICPQIKVCDYTSSYCSNYHRVDFMLAMKDCNFHTTFLAIECDGHEFHEKTKEQAARDKKRDRTLTIWGTPVIRFTGSEIWADPYRCVTEALSVPYAVLVAREGITEEQAYIAEREAEDRATMQ